MGLTVVTHTNVDWKRDLTRCINSVKDALPPGCKHEIIELTTSVNFNSARYKAKSIDDIIVFVDDDDYIPVDSLYKILNVMQRYEPGIVFTHETKVNINGSLDVTKPGVTYDRFYMHPQAIHHMTAYNTKYISSRSIDLIEKLKTHGSIEWAIRADTAYNGGAVYLPINGYYWVQHSGQHHAIPSVYSSFIDNMHTIGAELKQWYDTSFFTGTIPMVRDVDLGLI